MVGIRARLYGSYAVIIVLLACSVGAGLWGVQSLHRQGQVVAEQTTPYLMHLTDAAVTEKLAANSERGFLLTSDQKYVTEFDGRIVAVQASLKAASAMASTAAQRATIAQVGVGLASWSDLVHGEFTLQATDPGKALKLALGANRDVRKTFETLFDVATAQAAKALAASVAAQSSAATTAQRVLLALLGVAVAGAVAIAAWMSRQVTIPLREMQSLLTAAATGDLTGRATRQSRDEFGVVARAFNAMLDSLSTVMSTIASNATSLSAATEELTVASSQIAASSEEAAVQANVVAAAADDVSGNINTLATGAEEMGASIAEISHNANDASRVVTQAVTAVQDTNSTVTRLGESSREIGAFVKVITSIAQQTNLLALNATIEAARAGAAGKGFAVVANEVKELAQETARATEDITRRVESIQSDTAEAATAIAGISTLIGTINDYQMTIASAVEQQTATTQEMNRNVTGAATNSAEIAMNIGGVAAAAAMTTEGVAQTLTAGAHLSRMSTELGNIVAHFTCSRSAADASGSPIEAQLTKAIGAHGAWKKRLTGAISAGAHSEDATIVAMDDRCDFGRWLHGTTPAAGDRAYHATSMTLHADFHRAAAKTLHLVAGGHQAQAQAAMATGGAFAEASRLLTRTMMDWRRSIASPQPTARPMPTMSGQAR